MIKALRKIMIAFVAGVSLMCTSCGNSSIYTVKFDTNSLTMMVGGESVRLEATISSKSTLSFDSTLEWTSGDPNIVQVDSKGYLVALSEGNTYVTAALKIDSNAKATCSVTVTENTSDFAIEPTKAQLNLADLNLKTTKLTVMKNGKEYTDVDWKSKNKTVASVNSSGKVTAKSVGTAVIQATDEESSSSATCLVTVVDTSGVVTGITLSEKTLTLDAYNNTTATLVASVIGENDFTTEVNWTSSDRTVASVSYDGVVTALSTGTTTIKAASVADSAIFDTCELIVTDSAPVEISLDKTTLEISAGKTKQLNATVLHASNKTVTWSGSANGISVDQTGLVAASSTASVGATATIVAKSNEDPSKTASCVVTVIDQPTFQYDYTIMLYMCGSTLENNGGSGHDWDWYAPGGGSHSGSADPAYFTEDIKEILSVSLPSNVKVIIETGGTTKWGLSSSYIQDKTEISASELQRWEVVNGKIKFIEGCGTNQMAKTESFESFLEWGLKDYSATQMGVIISGHGGGIAGCAYDDNYNDNTLDNAEVVSAANTALNKYNRDKFTWIGYDCCLMQTADTASVNADYFDYMIASQESEFAEGWDHDTYLKKIIANPLITPEELLPVICSSFVSGGHNSYCTTREKCLQTLSALDLRKFDNLVTAFNNFVAETGTSSESKYKEAFTKAYCQFGEEMYGLVDFKNYMEELSTRFVGPNADAVISAIEEVVIANSYCSRYSFTPCGLNAFFPYSTDTYYGLQVSKSDYLGNNKTKFTSYQSMCLNYSSGW